MLGPIRFICFDHYFIFWRKYVDCADVESLVEINLYVVQIISCRSMPIPVYEISIIIWITFPIRDEAIIFIQKIDRFSADITSYEHHH